MADAAEALLTTPRGKPCRVVNGFSMCLHRANVKTLRHEWRCTRYNKGCTARGASFGLNGVIQMTSGDPHSGTMHNHVPDPTSPEKRRRRTVLKESAAANRATPSMALAADAQEGLEDAVLQAMPSQRALQQVVNRVRKITDAKEADLEPSLFRLPDPLKQTLRGERFLLVDTFDIDSNLPRILAFISPYGVQLLKDNRNWAIDGTFYAAPRHFDSLLMVHAFVGTTALPAAYITLPNRKQETYERAWDAVFGSEELSEVTPYSFLTDFEKGLMNSLTNRWQEAELLLCLFHFAKAIWTNIQKKGLLPVWSVPEAQVLFRCFMALPLLPRDEVVQGFKDLCSAFSELFVDKVSEQYKANFKKFTEYVAATYVGMKVNGRWSRPRYDINSWNCHERTLEGNPRTNNSVEGSHAFLNKLFPKAHVAMSQFICRIQKEDERIRNVSVRHSLNPAENLRGRPSNVTLREENLRAIVLEYSQTSPEHRHRVEFLTRVQYHLSPEAFARLVREEEADMDTPGASQQELVTPPSSQQDFLGDIVENECALASGDGSVAAARGQQLTRLVNSARSAASASHVLNKRFFATTASASTYSASATAVVTRGAPLTDFMGFDL